MKVYAAAKVKLLRPEILSLTLGFLGAIFSFIITLLAMAGGSSGRLIQLFESVYPWYSPDIGGIIFGIIFGFIYGYILGFLIGYFYTVLVRITVRDKMDFVLEINPDEPVNIIQNGEGENPYTIVIVANPVIYHKTFQINSHNFGDLDIPPEDTEDTKSKLEPLKDKPPITGRKKFLEKLSEYLTDEEINRYRFTILNNTEIYDFPNSFKEDPIINNKELFFKTVIRCFRSFLNNELLGQPEIFSRFKIVVIFDDNREIFKLTEQSLQELKDAKIPEVTTEKLKSIVNEEFTEKEKFIDVLKSTIGDKQTAKYESKILTCAKIREINNNALCEAIDLSSEIIAPRLAIDIVDNYVKDVKPGYQLNDSGFKRMGSDGNIDAEIIEKLQGLKGKYIPKTEIEKHLEDCIGNTEASSLKGQILTYADDFEGNSDVIMLISASDTFIRSSARFTEDDNDRCGEKFAYQNNSETFIRKHAFYAKKPGVAAIWAGDDRLKTPVHEFAHAMSSLQNGPIVDEYNDDPIDLFEFTVNKQMREDPRDPIPRFFARYGIEKEAEKGWTVYYSNRTRSDKREGWFSYVPEKFASGISSTMDYAYFDFRYNKLVFNFMYDRLLTKLNRDRLLNDKK